MRCPECETPLDAAFRCANWHAWPEVDGVRRLISAECARILDPFLAVFARHRMANGRIDDPRVFPGLPESGLAIDRAVWGLRVLDLRLVMNLISERKTLDLFHDPSLLSALTHDPSPKERERSDPERGPLRILDVGAWNGWLSHRLAALGHRVIATDVFTDAFDGLGAVRHYPVKFTAIQCDQERLHLLDGPFDLVIAQRCMGYMTDIPRSIAQLRSLLAPDGSVLFTGLNIFRDPSRIRRHFERSSHAFEREHGTSFFFKPVKGYLDTADEPALRANGVQLRSYPALAHKNLLAHLFPWKPLYRYGILRHGN